MKKEVSKDLFEGMFLIGSALICVLLLVDYTMVDDGLKTIIIAAVLILVLLTCAIFYFKYRKSHYRQIYTKDELKKQNR